MAKPDDLGDCDAVLEYSLDAHNAGDDEAILSLFAAATDDKLTPQVIVNVLSATLGNASPELNAFMGWRTSDPLDRVTEAREAFIARASAWLDQHEPERKAGLLRGLVKPCECVDRKAEN